MEQEMELVRIDDLEPSVPDGHWGVVSRFVEQGQRLTVQFCHMAPDGGADPHVHNEQDQMFFVLRGALEVRGAADGVVVVRAGEALRIPAGACHATVSAHEGSTDYLVLTYPAAQGQRGSAAAHPGATIGP